MKDKLTREEQAQIDAIARRARAVDAELSKMIDETAAVLGASVSDDVFDDLMEFVHNERDPKKLYAAIGIGLS